MGSGLRRYDFIKVGDTEVPSRAYVKFGFKGFRSLAAMAYFPVARRNRLNLALRSGREICCFWMSLPADLDIEEQKAGSGS